MTPAELADPTPTDRPRRDGSDIRKAAAADVPSVAQALALAFYDDPHMRWIVRDDERRLERLARGFEAFTRGMWLARDSIYTTEQFSGAAIWLPPGQWLAGPLVQLRMLPSVVAALRGDLVRLLRAFTYIERKHPRTPPHWYLAIVGVAPSWQGRGYGHALLQPVLERCDRERAPAYLEASTARNVALYERHGFEVVAQRSYARDAPPLWRMWREPR